MTTPEITPLNEYNDSSKKQSRASRGQKQNPKKLRQQPKLIDWDAVKDAVKCFLPIGIFIAFIFGLITLVVMFCPNK